MRNERRGKGTFAVKKTNAGQLPLARDSPLSLNSIWFSFSSSGLTSDMGLFCWCQVLGARCPLVLLAQACVLQSTLLLGVEGSRCAGMVGGWMARFAVQEHTEWRFQMRLCGNARATKPRENLSLDK